ncbi:zinc finger, C2H2 type [Cooperia oncophora]
MNETIAFKASVMPRDRSFESGKVLNESEVAAIKSRELGEGLRPQKKPEGSPINNVPSSPQQAMNMHLGGAFPFSLVPTTSTASSQASVIMSSSDSARDDVTPPAGKRIKTEEDDEKTARDSAATAVTSTFKCNECDKAFKSLEFLEHHKLMQHSGFSQQLLTGLLPQGFPSLPFMLPGGLPQQFQMPDMDSLSAMNTPKQARLHSETSRVPRLELARPIGRFGCITKEMHGIVIDENKTVIANIDTLEKERMGTLSFRCDICHTEHKSRHLLRQHKQDVHGVVPLSTPSNRKPSTMSSPAIGGSGAVAGDEKLEKCPLCERRMPASNLTNHIQAEHTGGGGMSMTQAPPASPSLECKFCPTTFKDQMELHLHQINQHTVELLQQSQHVDTVKKASDTTTVVLRCRRCQYSTRDPRNLEMHVERHERMNEATRESGAEINSDAALRATTEAALKMMVANQSGSMSPSGESLPEGFGKPDSGSCDEKHVMQSFVLRCTADASGAFLSEMIAHLPVRTLLSQPTRVSFELVPHQVSNDSNPF